jgi:hypothetical protein
MLGMMLAMMTATTSGIVFVRVKYPGYRRPLGTVQNSTYDRFPPAVNGWGTVHPVSGKVPPLQAEEEGPST